MNIEKYGSGIPLVFVHGAGGSTLSWAYQITYFEETNTVTLVDLPGHGASEGPALASISGYADALKDAFEDNSIGPAFIVGHSMGGAIGMEFAVRYPDLTRGLVLIGSGARLKVYPEILQGVLKDKGGTARMIIDTAFSDTFPARLKEKIFTEYMKNDARTIFNDFSAWGRLCSANSRARAAAVDADVRAPGDAHAFVIDAGEYADSAALRWQRIEGRLDGGELSEAVPVVSDGHGAAAALACERQEQLAAVVNLPPLGAQRAGRCTLPFEYAEGPRGDSARLEA